MPATARRWGTAGGRSIARRGFGGWCCPSARGNSPGSSCDAGGPGQLRVAVRLLVEPPVSRDLLQLEPLHRNRVERASLDAQGAADAALLVEDHRGSLLPAVGLLDLWQQPFGLQLIDVDHVDDALGADVGAGAAQDAAERIEPDVVVAHQTPRRFGNGGGRVVTELDRRREVDLRLRRRHPRGDWCHRDVLTREDVAELGHVVPPRTRDLDVRADRDVRSAAQVAVDRVGALLAVPRSLDQGRRASHEIAAGEDALDVRCIRRRIDPDTATADLEVRLDRQEREVRGLGNGRNDDVRLDRELAALDRDRRPPARGIRLAEPVPDELNGGDVAVLAEDLDRAGEEFHPDALALCLAELLLVNDQLAAGSAVDDRDVLGPVAEAGPGAVHGGVAAADDDDVLADVQLLAEVRLLHEVDAVVDAFEVGTRNVEGDGVHRAGRDRNAVEVALELLERDVLADRRVEDERDPESLDEPDVHLDCLARQAERRDADEHRPAAIGQRVEDGDLEALHRELAGDRQAGRPGAHDRDALVARRDLGHHVRDARRLVPLHEEPLHRPDRERTVDVASPARPLAGGGTDVGAHRRDRVRLARENVALFEPALSREIQVAAAVRSNRAGFLALDVALEPGRVDGLNEEFLKGVDRQVADVPFCTLRSPGVRASRRAALPAVRIYHPRRERRKSRGPRSAADLTLIGVAATLSRGSSQQVLDRVRPRRTAERDRERVCLSGARTGARR